MARPKSENKKKERTIRLSETMSNKLDLIAEEKGYSGFADFARFLFQREIDNHEKKKENDSTRAD